MSRPGYLAPWKYVVIINHSNGNISIAYFMTERGAVEYVADQEEEDFDTTIAKVLLSTVEDDVTEAA